MARGNRKYKLGEGRHVRVVKKDPPAPWPNRRDDETVVVFLLTPDRARGSVVTKLMTDPEREAVVVEDPASAGEVRRLVFDLLQLMARMPGSQPG